MRCWIIVPPSLQELEELLRATLLKEAHQRTLNRLHLRTRDLGNPAITIDEAAGNLLELEVACNFGVHQDLGHLARRDDELWDKINGIVAITTKLGGWSLIWAKLAIKLRGRELRLPDLLAVHTWVKFRLALSPP